MAQKTLFAWRNSLLSANGPSSPTTRLVLLTLSTYMTVDGDSCFPTTKTLAEQTGLSHRSVCTHLEIAVQEGWILRKLKGTNGQGWRRHEYVPIVQQGGEGDSPPLGERGEPDDIKVVKEVHTNSKENSITPSRTTNGDAYPAEFERVWGLYPTRTGGNPKKAALRAWKARLHAGADLESLEQGVARYAEFCKQTGKVGTGYVKMASTFFGPDEWWKESWASADESGRPDLAVL